MSSNTYLNTDYINLLSAISHNNKYFKLYAKMITHNWDMNCYTEKHHILPTSISDNTESKKDKNNIVSIPLRVHFILHKLLPKFLIKEDHIIKMQCAIWSFMMCKNSKRDDIILNSKDLTYSHRVALYTRKSLKWIHNPITKEKKRIVDLSNIPEGWITGRGDTWNKGITYTDEQKKNIPKMYGEDNPFYNKKHTEETKLKLRKPKTFENPKIPKAIKAYTYKSPVYLFINKETYIFDCLTKAAFIHKYGEHPSFKNNILTHKRWEILEISISPKDHTDYIRFV